MTALHPDRVLLDVYLPDRSGLDVLRDLLTASSPSCAGPVLWCCRRA